MKIKGETTWVAPKEQAFHKVNLSGKSTFIGRNSGESSFRAAKGETLEF